MGPLQHLNSPSSLVLLYNPFNSLFLFVKYNTTQEKISAGFKLRTLGNITIFGEEIKCLVEEKGKINFRPAEFEIDYTLYYIFQ